MCVKTVTKSTGVLNSAEDAPNTGTSRTSEPRLRLLCVPTRLPETKIPKTEEYQETDKSKQAELKAYFYAAGFRRFYARRTI
jgi:hypothetical protein